MKHPTPDFWYEKSASLTSLALWPLGCIYHLAGKIRQYTTKPFRATVPVICVGNLTAGGAGKTPVALAVHDLLCKEFSSPCFLTRGFGRTFKESLYLRSVTDRGATYLFAGDEALLLLQKSPVVIIADRVAGAKQAIENSADLLIMDDGLQNPSLEKTLNLCVVDGRVGFGNQNVIPAGPLRMSLRSGFQDCDAIIILGDDLYGARDVVPDDIPVFQAYLEPLDARPPQAKKYVGFAGIGLPDKFYRTLLDLEYDIPIFVPFADHHDYSSDDIERLEKIAQDHQAELITTEKDAVRIDNLPDTIHILKVQLCWEDEDAVRSFILGNLDREGKL